MQISSLSLLRISSFSFWSECEIYWCTFLRSASRATLHSAPDGHWSTVARTDNDLQSALIGHLDYIIFLKLSYTPKIYDYATNKRKFHVSNNSNPSLYTGRATARESEKPQSSTRYVFRRLWLVCAIGGKGIEERKLDIIKVGRERKWFSRKSPSWSWERLKIKRDFLINWDL